MRRKFGQPRRSDATKAAILRAARERFAADGYEKATIRAIAAGARIDPAMVMRYFVSKEKLFAAAADFDLRVPDLTAVSWNRLGQTMVAHFFDRWEGDDVLKALLRASATNQAAAARLRSIFATQFLPRVAALFDDHDKAVKSAALIGTQAVGFAFARYVLRLPPVVAMQRDEVVEWMGPTFQRYLAEFGARRRRN